ncbi:MAG: triphosphoribosyl-dephospho-CoA synthase, partial [Halobacteriota archaeon]
MTPAENAELALLLEASAEPKPGNVTPSSDHDDTTYEHYLASAVGCRSALDAVARGDVGIGEGFREAVEGAHRHGGGNTCFGSLLLLVPLVRAAADGDVEDAADVARETTVDDAAEFYRAFDAVEVNLGGPPAADLPDARSPREAAEAV